MHLKKIFTKIIAATLSVTAFLGTLPAQAVYDRNAHRNIRDWVINNDIRFDDDPINPDVYQGLAEESRIFDHLTEGDTAIRFVPELACTTIHPLCSLIFLNVINRFFETHPGIKHAFIDMIKERGGDQFVLSTTKSPRTYSGFCSSRNPSILVNEDKFARANILRTFDGLARQIYSNKSIIPFPSNPPRGRDYFYLWVDMTLYLAYHELGHLIQDVFTFYRIKGHSTLSRCNIGTLCAYAKEAIRRDPGLRDNNYKWFALCKDPRTQATMSPTDWQCWVTASDKYSASTDQVRLSMKDIFRHVGGIESKYISDYDRNYDSDEATKAAESWAELYSYSRWLSERHRARMAADTLVAELETSFEMNLPDLLSQHVPLRGVL